MGLNRKAIGAHVAACRKSAKMTQEQLAEKTELSIQQISYIENGRTGQSLASLLKIANALETTLDPFIVSELSTSKREIITPELNKFFSEFSTEELEQMYDGLNSLYDLMDAIKKYKEISK